MDTLMPATTNEMPTPVWARAIVTGLVCAAFIGGILAARQELKVIDHESLVVDFARTADQETRADPDGPNYVRVAKLADGSEVRYTDWKYPHEFSGAERNRLAGLLGPTAGITNGDGTIQSLSGGDHPIWKIATPVQSLIDLPKGQPAAVLRPRGALSDGAPK